jgi:hypothetical protein
MARDFAGSPFAQDGEFARSLEASQARKRIASSAFFFRDPSAPSFRIRKPLHEGSRWLALAFFTGIVIASFLLFFLVQ